MGSVYKSGHSRTEHKKPHMFKIFVKPALKNKSGFFAANLFDSEGTTRIHKNKKYYNYEKVLKLSMVKGYGIRWTSCIFIPAKLHNEALVLRRANISGQKLWIPVRPSSSGLSKWTELIMPQMVGDTPVWVSAEGIVGYLRPVKILGVQVWLPTSSTKNKIEEIKPKQSKRKSKPDVRTSRNRRLIYSSVHLKSGSILTVRRPRLVVLDLPIANPSKIETEKKKRERILYKKAVKTIARKLVEKTESVYPQVDLDTSSSESFLDMDNNPERRDKEKQRQLGVASRPSRDRKGEFYGFWDEEEADSKNYRQDFLEGRPITTFFLPNQVLPIITAIGQPPSREDDDSSLSRKLTKIK